MEIIIANLCQIEGVVNISFVIDSKTINLNLESDDSNEVKKLFLEFAKQIRKNSLKIELKVDEEFDMNSNRLFYDASVEYVNQLNKELEILESDEDLIEIRKY